MEPSNCYQVFDCDENVSKDHIKAQYKKIALQMHPDKSTFNETRSLTLNSQFIGNNDVENFKLVTRAYKILSDDGERRKHDANLTYHRTEASVMGDEVAWSEFSAEDGFFSYSCRCGSSYTLEEDELARVGIVSLACPGCSLHIVVKKEAENVPAVNGKVESS